MAAKQTCICCGSLLQGSETSYTFTCYKCVSEHTTKSQILRAKKYLQDLYTAAYKHKDNATEFTHNSCWYKFNNDGFYGYYLMHSVEVITKVYKWDCATDIGEPRMKPFNLEQAKAGAPVCTRDGQPVRIVCYDLKGHKNYPILTLVESPVGVESTVSYALNGHHSLDSETGIDLMMASVKREGWVNLYALHSDVTTTDQYALYPSEKEARSQVRKGNGVYVTTVKIEWED